MYQIEMLRKQLTAGISSTDVKLDVSLSTLKPLSMAWLLRAFAGLKDCKPGILSAFVKSGTAKAWDVDFQRRAAGDVNRLFSMLPGPADAASDEVAPVLTEEQQRIAPAPVLQVISQYPMTAYRYHMAKHGYNNLHDPHINEPVRTQVCAARHLQLFRKSGKPRTAP